MYLRQELLGFLLFLFFLAGALGMILMLVFAFRMDSSDPKVNWMEQTVNSLAQICFFIGLMLAWRSASKERKGPPVDGSFCIRL